MFKKNIGWWVLVLAFSLTILFMYLSKEKIQVDANILPWNSHFNAQGELVALGLILNKSTPNDAFKIFGYDYEVLAFSKKDLSEKVIEIYFPTMNVARIRGVVTLVLDVSDSEVAEMFARGTTITINQSGNRQVTLLSRDSASLMDNKIKYFTFVPKKNLPEDVLRHRFGNPATIKPAEKDIYLWGYPSKGLEIIVNTKGADILQFSEGAGIK